MSTGLENLKIYTMAEELELTVFHLTKNFPHDEKYRSIDQLTKFDGLSKKEFSR